MAYDEGQAQTMREALAGHVNISEKKMFGGLCFMKNGHMLCGVHKDGGMFRVGKELEASALEVEGVRPMGFTGRPMRGMVEIDDEVLEDDARMARLIGLADQFNSGLEPK